MFYYDGMPTRNKERRCKCKCKTYIVHDGDDDYVSVCEYCYTKYRFKASSLDEAVLKYNSIIESEEEG